LQSLLLIHTIALNKDRPLYLDNMSPAFTALQFHQSFERCVNDPRFIDKFYEIFLSSSDEINILFKDTNMETQKVMLVTSMAFMTRAYENNPSFLSEIAEKHNSNNLGIKPHLYPLWLNSLISTAKLIDPLFDMDTENLWREIMQPGIDYMISKYNDAL